ncbi:hypothetical protein PINS_up006811 [Pythium insidiosum]|nr:hypothetical protein PINS_up006811 [Pythium insidiosum]
MTERASSDVDPRVVSLVRMHESRQRDDRDDHQTKAYRLVVALVQERDGASGDGNRLMDTLQQRLRCETAPGHSAYSTEVSVVSIVQAIFWALRGTLDLVEGEKIRILLVRKTLVLLHESTGGAAASSSRAGAADGAASIAPAVVLVLMQELHRLRMNELPSVVTEVLRGLSVAYQRQRAQQPGMAYSGVQYRVILIAR